METYDVGMIIPLLEEFRIANEIFPIADSYVHDAIHYYRVGIPQTELRVLAVTLGDMGPSLAAHVTEKMLNHAQFKTILLLGLAGSLDKDVLLGDVVVASEVNEFQAVSKSVPKDNSFAFQYSGHHWPTDFALKNLAGNFEFSATKAFNKWRREVQILRNALGFTKEQFSQAHAEPQIHVGHVASGDTVGASLEYAVLLRGIDRKFLALEMEAAGVERSAHGRLQPVRTLIARGISDFSDERKRELDGVGHGNWRKYAMYAASIFALNLLQTDGFHRIVHVDYAVGSESVNQSAIQSQPQTLTKSIAKGRAVPIHYCVRCGRKPGDSISCVVLGRHQFRQFPGPLDSINCPKCGRKPGDSISCVVLHGHRFMQYLKPIDSIFCPKCGRRPGDSISCVVLGGHQFPEPSEIE